MTATVLVLAKEPLAGRSKTRLIGPWTPQQAADLAEAALADTLETAVAAGGDVVCVLDGSPGTWLPPGVPVVAQTGGSLGDRIAAGFDAAFARDTGPVLLVGMDTPQLTVAGLQAAAAALRDHDACLGPANDGGWWCLGLTAPLPRPVIASVPTSRADTGALQHAALTRAGLSVAMLPELVDVDTPDEARLVAGLAPASRFAERLRTMTAAA